MKAGDLGSNSTGFADYDDCYLTTLPMVTNKSPLNGARARWGHSEAIQQRVLGRDAGICDLCGLDTVSLYQLLEWVERRCDGYWEGKVCDPLQFADFKRAVGAAARPYPRVLWQVDMVLPAFLGGTEELANLRTLCWPCHRLETRRVLYGHTISALARRALENERSARLETRRIIMATQ